MDRPRAGRRTRLTEKDKRRAATRAALVEAARRKFSEFGYDATSVTEIARDAGVSHSMINVYFNGKAGLLYEIVKELNAPQLEQTRTISEASMPAPDRIDAILSSWLDQDLSDPRLLAVLQSYSWVWPPETEAENREVRHAFQAELARVIGEGQAGGVFAPRLSPDAAAQAIWALYTWVCRSAVFGELTIEECRARLLAQVSALLGREG